MAEAAVTFLLEQVKEVVVGYADLIKGAEKEFKLLNDELDMLKTFLKQTAEKKKDPLLMKLEREIRSVIYEVEDTIDTCLAKTMETKAKKSFIRRGVKLPSVNLAKEVKSIREDRVLPLFAMAERSFKMKKLADEYAIDEQSTNDSKWDPPMRQQNRIVGFEDEEKTITEYLMQPREKLDVISIVGIPGQGKTTLAWKLFNNKDTHFHFPIRIWIAISQVFNSRDVFLQILKKFIPTQDPNSLSDNELAQYVRACLEKEKFLLVLDDVWSVDAWKIIKEVLPLKNGDGKVLITSREIDVGIQSKVYRDPHNLRFLTRDESWKLLQYEVFDNEEDCMPELEPTGRLIANKCDGVPLTIVVIGGILKDQLTTSLSTAVTEWKTVSENVSEALQDDKAQQRITNVVKLSYNRLPDHLRECFVFLGVFPEDYEIPAKTLCGLWIAEGFVLPRRGKTLEESAELNMNDLICRNLLKVEKTNHMGKVKSCRVHDIIRAFCINISKEENLCQEIKRSKEGVFEPSIPEIKDSHRLCFRSDLSKFLAQNPCGPHVRSFMCFYEQPYLLKLSKFFQKQSPCCGTCNLL